MTCRLPDDAFRGPGHTPPSRAPAPPSIRHHIYLNRIEFPPCHSLNRIPWAAAPLPMWRLRPLPARHTYTLIRPLLSPEGIQYTSSIYIL